VLRALQERGRPVPEDVAVIGFDDIPESPYFIPPLTTVRQDFQRVGEAAVQILVDQLTKGDREPVNVIIDPVLVCRESTLPASVRNTAAGA